MTSSQPKESSQAKQAAHDALDQPVLATLIHSLASSALISMGLVPKMKDKKNLTLAQFNIDLLILLREKTQNNLTPDETLLLNNCIRDLQISFSQIKQHSQTK